MTPHELLTVYDQAYQQRFHQRAPIVQGKDGRQAARLLKLYTPECLCRWLQHFFETPDPFIQQSGYTFSVFACCIGKLIVRDVRMQPQGTIEERYIAQRIARRIAERREQELAEERARHHGKQTL